MIIQKKALIFTLILIVFQLENVITERQQKPSLPSTFLWKPLLEVENEHFTKAFLPSYLNFTRDIVGSKWISPACSVRFQTALDALTLRRNWASKL